MKRIKENKKRNFLDTKRFFRIKIRRSSSPNIIHKNEES
jgi:hypothetical protein